MGLPQVKITFESLYKSIIERSERGIVALIVNDSTATNQVYEFNSINDVTKSTFSEKVYDYIDKTFLGNPRKVFVEVINTTNQRTLQSVLSDLETKRFNYLAIPEAESSDATTITSWIKTCRQNGKKYKAVLANSQGDNEGIINFTTTGIKVGSKSYTTAEYCARLAGIFAGLSIDRSATYYVLDEVTEIVKVTNADTAIDGGELILINDGEKIKIARAVNSLKTLAENQSEELKKIKIVEAIDIIYEDISKTFEDEYIGKVLNKYDNKILFIAAVNAYFKGLQKSGALDPDEDAYVDIDEKANEAYLQGKNVDTSTYTETEIRKANTGSKLFLTGKIRPLDAMEDLDLTLYM